MRYARLNKVLHAGLCLMCVLLCCLSIPSARANASLDKDQLAALLLLLQQSATVSEASLQSLRIAGLERVSGRLDSPDGASQYVAKLSVGSERLLEIPLAVDADGQFSFVVPPGVLTEEGFVSGSVDFSIVARKLGVETVLLEDRLQLASRTYTGVRGLPTLLWAETVDLLAGDALAQIRQIQTWSGAAAYAKAAERAQQAAANGGAGLRRLLGSLLDSSNPDIANAVIDALDSIFYPLLLEVAPNAAAGVDFNQSSIPIRDLVRVASQPPPSGSGADGGADSRRGVFLGQTDAVQAAAFLSPLDEFLDDVKNIAREVTDAPLDAFRKVRDTAAKVAIVAAVVVVAAASAPALAAVAAGAKVVAVAAGTVAALGTVQSAMIAVTLRSGTAAIIDGEVEWEDIREPVRDYAGVVSDQVVGALDGLNVLDEAALGSVLDAALDEGDKVLADGGFDDYRGSLPSLSESVFDFESDLAALESAANRDFSRGVLPRNGDPSFTPVQINVELEDLTFFSPTSFTDLFLEFSIGYIDPPTSDAYQIEVFADGSLFGAIDFNLGTFTSGDSFSEQLFVPGIGCPEEIEVVVTHIASGSSGRSSIPNWNRDACRSIISFAYSDDDIPEGGAINLSVFSDGGYPGDSIVSLRADFQRDGSLVTNTYRQDYVIERQLSTGSWFELTPTTLSGSVAVFSIYMAEGPQTVNLRVRGIDDGVVDPGEAVQLWLLSGELTEDDPTYTVNYDAPRETWTTPYLPIIEQAQCGIRQENVSGYDEPDRRNFSVGAGLTQFLLTYEMIRVKDRIIVFGGGSTLYDSGCRSGGTTVGFSFDAGQNPSGRITVEVIPNCEGTTGTQWSYTLSCN